MGHTLGSLFLIAIKLTLIQSSLNGSEIVEGHIDYDRASWDYSDPAIIAGRVITFACREVNKNISHAYLQEVDSVIKFNRLLRASEQYEVDLRFRESDCQSNDDTCDPCFVGPYSPNREYTPVVASMSPYVMKPGKEVKIFGSVPMYSKGFHITVQKGYNSPVNAQLRISAKFFQGENEIHFKYFNTSWILQSQQPGFLEIKKKFTIVIKCLADKFEIYNDDKLFASLDHVMPYQDATHVVVSGDVYTSRIEGFWRTLTHGIYTASDIWNSGEFQSETEIYVPFVAPLATTLKPGKSLSIRGRVFQYSSVFAITLQSGSEIQPITAPLRMWVNFTSEGTKSALTSYYKNQWQIPTSIENTDGFKLGEEFHIVITCLQSHFKIYVNGEEYAMYDHHISCADLTHLSTSGVVDITEVTGITRLPAIKVFDKEPIPRVQVPLRNLPLTVGRKFNIWLYTSKAASGEHINVRLGSIQPEVYSLDVHIDFGSEKDPYNSLMYHFDYFDRIWKRGPPINATWLKQVEQLVQMEITCLKDSFKVVFFGVWEDRFEYHYPLHKLTVLEVFGHAQVLVDDGIEYNAAKPASRALRMATQVCSFVVISQPGDLPTDMWVRTNSCKQE